MTSHDRRRAALGLSYLLIVIMLMAVCFGTFRQAMPWQQRPTLVIKTRHAGMQLSTHADVKLQGVVVGEVQSITSNGSEATITLAISPASLREIPRNVSVHITPKTLFGSKYVALSIPSAPDGHVTSGAVITQSTTSVELDQLFNEIVPLLRALNPAQLSITLNALSSALQGRGDELGSTMSKLHGYLTELNPQLPALMQDVNRLAAASDVWSQAAPDLINVLDNARATTQELLVPHENSLTAVLASTIKAADTATGTINRDGADIVTLVGQAAPLEQLLADYSSEYPCLITSLNRLDQLAGKAFGGDGPYLRVSIDLVVHRKTYRYPQDAPGSSTSDASNENLPAMIRSWAPYCAAETAQMKALATQPAAATNTVPPSAPNGGKPSSGTPQATIARAVAAHALHVSPTEVPPVAVLLLEPLVNSGEVSVR